MTPQQQRRCPSMFLGNHCEKPPDHPGPHYTATRHGPTRHDVQWTDEAADQPRAPA